MGKKQSKIEFDITLDENNVPEEIIWTAEDANSKSEGKGVFMSVWDKNEENTLSLNLWTKDLNTEEMKRFYHQALVSMTESFERAVPNEEEVVKDMFATCNYFAEKMGLISKEEVDRMIDEANKKLDDDLDLTSMTQK